MDEAYPNMDFCFLDIANIHVMRERYGVCGMYIGSTIRDVLPEMYYLYYMHVYRDVCKCMHFCQEIRYSPQIWPFEATFSNTLVVFIVSMSYEKCKLL